MQIWIDVSNGKLQSLVRAGAKCTDPKELKKAWFKLNNSYTKSFGVDRGVRRILELRKQYALKMAEFLETGDRMFEMEYQLIKVDIEQENNVGKKDKATFIDIVTTVEKHYGFQLDLNVTTVEKFYSYLKKMRTENEKLSNFKATK